MDVQVVSTVIQKGKSTATVEARVEEACARPSLRPSQPRHTDIEPRFQGNRQAPRPRDARKGGHLASDDVQDLSMVHRRNRAVLDMPYVARGGVDWPSSA